MLKVLAIGIGMLVAGPAWAINSQDVTDWDYSYCRSGDAEVVTRVEGREYGAARETLIAEGWEPVANAELVNNQQDVRLDFARDAGWVEVEDCSSDGHCRMNMSDAEGNVLRIITYSERVDGGGLVCAP